MKPTLRNLKLLRARQELISIRREKCEDRSLQGFIIGVSSEMLLIQHIYDFYLDGLILLRIADISEIITDETEELQKHMLIEEGDFAKIPFDASLDISSYVAFLKSLASSEIIILEDELADDPVFLIGEFSGVDGSRICIRYFNGAAEWDDQPSEIETERVTCCRVRSNYINYYSKYFMRLKTQK